jgi:hypothetical protein
MSDEIRGRRRQWRDYRSPAGRRPVKEFLDGLSDEDAAAVAAAMRDVLVKASPSRAICAVTSTRSAQEDVPPSKIYDERDILTNWPDLA